PAVLRKRFEQFALCESCALNQSAAQCSPVCERRATAPNPVQPNQMELEFVVMASMTAPIAVPSPAPSATVSRSETTCRIVGGGPAGAMLALLLARRGVRVTLLEMHKDFDREFRGDTVHPSTLEILDQLGLAEKVHRIPHSKVYGPSVMTSQGLFQPFDLRRLKTKFPYILMVPQSKFLEFLTGEAARYPQCRLKMGASVYDLIRENGSVRGVRYQTSETQEEVRALLTVGA